MDGEVRTAVITEPTHPGRAFIQEAIPTILWTLATRQVVPVRAIQAEADPVREALAVVVPMAVTPVVLLAAEVLAGQRLRLCRQPAPDIRIPEVVESTRSSRRSTKVNVRDETGRGSLR